MQAEFMPTCVVTDLQAYDTSTPSPNCLDLAATTRIIYTQTPPTMGVETRWAQVSVCGGASPSVPSDTTTTTIIQVASPSCCTDSTVYPPPPATGQPPIVTPPVQPPTGGVTVYPVAGGRAGQTQTGTAQGQGGSQTGSTVGGVSGGVGGGCVDNAGVRNMRCQVSRLCPSCISLQRPSVPGIATRPCGCFPAGVLHILSRQVDGEAPWRFHAARCVSFI